MSEEPRSRRLELRITLEEDMASRFEVVKKRYGFENNTDVVRFLITKTHDAILKRRRAPTEPKIELINTFEDRVTLREIEEDRIFNVYFRGSVLWCELCDKTSCIHVGFTYAIPKALQILEAKGMSSKPPST